MTEDKTYGEDWHAGFFMQTFTGRKFYPLAPRAEDVDPLDIAHSLALQCRYNGHVNKFYSVAEHCILMSDYFLDGNHPLLAKKALLHDGTETFVGDMIRPLKHQPEMQVFREAEDKVGEAIAERFGLATLESVTVKVADSRILLTERAALMGGKVAGTWAVDGMEPLPVTIRAWQPKTAEAEYLARMEALGLC